MMSRQPKAQLGRPRRIGGLKFLYNRLIYHRGKFYDEAEEPSHEFIDNLPGVLETLKQRERLVLILRYLEDEPRSLAQVAQITWATKERVQQIEVKALLQLIHVLKKNGLYAMRLRRSRGIRHKEGDMRGLTLIEVLIVVAILAILAVLIGPYLFRLLGGG